MTSSQSKRLCDVDTMRTAEDRAYARGYIEHAVDKSPSGAAAKHISVKFPNTAFWTATLLSEIADKAEKAQDSTMPDKVAKVAKLYFENCSEKDRLLFTSQWMTVHARCYMTEGKCHLGEKCHEFTTHVEEYVTSARETKATREDTQLDFALKTCKGMQQSIRSHVEEYERKRTAATNRRS